MPKYKHPLTFYKEIVNNCKYLQPLNKNIKTTSSRDSYCSLSYLIKHINLSQSEKIKLGKGLECFLNDAISTNKSWKILKVQLDFNCQIDELIINEKEKKIIYSEYKSNLALDSQKRNIMYIHCSKIQTLLQEKYPDYTISTFILNLRFLSKEDIPKYIIQRFDKYNNVLTICGLNDYLQIFNLQIFENYFEYTNLLEYICMQKFSK